MTNRIFIKKLVQTITNCSDLQAVHDIEEDLRYCKVFSGATMDIRFGTISKTGGHSVLISNSEYRTWTSILDAIHIAKVRISHEL